MSSSPLATVGSGLEGLQSFSGLKIVVFSIVFILIFLDFSRVHTHSLDTIAHVWPICIANGNIKLLTPPIHTPRLLYSQL